MPARSYGARNTRHVVASSQSTTSSPETTPKTTPKKPAKTTRKASRPLKGAAASRPIHSFFNAATQRQQNQNQNLSEQATDANGKDSAVEPDDIEDDASNYRKSLKRTFSSLSSEQTSANNAAPAALFAKSNKFLKTTHSPLTNASEQALKAQDTRDEDPRPWNERYGPQTLDELAVHKRKVADVREWLEAVVKGRSDQRVLVLKGATGSGKTVTLMLLAKALGLEVLDWKNPAAIDYSSAAFSSVSSQFDEFLNRGGSFQMLEFEEDRARNDLEEETSIGQDSSRQGKILLAEEFPSMTGSSEAFRGSLLRYIASGPIGLRGTVSLNPLVVIVSESLFSGNARATDNLTAYRLLGPELLNNPAVRVIEFNPVAPTFISKALNLVLQKRSKESRDTARPNQDVLKKLSEMGDIRNSVSSLEFICLQKEGPGLSTRPVVAQKSKSKSSKSESTVAKPENTAALNLVSLRENSLGLFHAIGKIVYNKRTLPTPASNATEGSLPEHLSLKKRTHPSEVDVAELGLSSGVETSTFIAALHENFLMSTESPNHDIETSLNIIGGILDSLSDSDIMLNHIGSGEMYGSTHEKQVQSELAFHVGGRGALFHLPHPVRRAALQAVPGRSGKADAHRMFFPVSLKLWKRKEEVMGSLDWLTNKAMNGTLYSHVRLQRPQQLVGESQTGIISQPGRMPAAPAASVQFDTHVAKTPSSEIATLSLGSGHSARQEMLLDRLPYLARILQSNTSSRDGAGSLYRQVQAVTKLAGAGKLMSSATDEDEGEGVENGAGEGGPVVRGDGRGPIKRGQRSGFGEWSSFLGGGGGLGPSRAGEVDSASADVAKLVLSDDDIEDD